MGGQPLEEQAPAREQLLSPQPRFGYAEQRAQPRGEKLALGEIVDPFVERQCELRGCLLLGRLLGDAHPLADHLGQRPVGDPLSVREAPT